MVNVTAVEGDITTFETDAIVVNIFDGATSPVGAGGDVDKALGGAITTLIADKEITGKQNELAMIHTLGKLPSKRVVVLGLGKREKFTTETVRSASAVVARYLQRIGAKKAAMLTLGVGIGGLEAGASAQATTEGAMLGLYSFKQYKAKHDDQPDKEMEELTIVEPDKSRLRGLGAGVDKGQLLAEAVAHRTRPSERARQRGEPRQDGRGGNRGRDFPPPGYRSPRSRRHAPARHGRIHWCHPRHRQ